MITIRKQQLEIVDEQTLFLPAGAEPLHVGLWQDVPHLWFRMLDNTKDDTYPRKILIQQEGFLYSQMPGNYLGAFMGIDAVHGSAHVYFVFESFND